MYKITVILPCYNVGLYLERCLDSIINQDIGYKNLQIIAVNDGSTDDTLDVLLQYEQRYTDNICVINLEENRGISYARNLAMQYAVADYIMFIDADDWIEPDMLQRMWEIADTYDIDMVMCKHDRPSSDEAIRGRVGRDEYYECNCVESRKELVMHLMKRTTCWERLIKKQVLIENNITFVEGYKYEDIYWASCVHMAVNKVYVLNEILYHWYNNPDSLTNSKENEFHRLIIQLLLLQRAKEQGYYECYKEEIEYGFYEKAFVETIFYMSMFGECTVEIVQLLKDKLLEKCDILHNVYYLGERKVEPIIGEEIIRKLLHVSIDEVTVGSVIQEIKQRYVK